MNRLEALERKMQDMGDTQKRPGIRERSGSDEAGEPGKNDDDYNQEGLTWF